MSHERGYTRRHRAIANAALLASLWLLWQLAAGKSVSFFVLALLSLAPGLIYYGYFLSSQMCSECHEPVFLPGNEPVFWRMRMLFAALHVPMKCPHCGAATRW